MNGVRINPCDRPLTTATLNLRLHIRVLHIRA